MGQKLVMDKKYSYIPTDSLIRKYCEKKFNISKEIGHGIYGTVYEICCNDDCSKYILKIITYKNIPIEIAKKSFDKEVRLQKKAASINITSNIIDSWFIHNDESSSNGYIIMERFDKTLEEYIKINGFSSSLAINIISLIQTLHRANFIHGDTHIQNFMFNKNGVLFLIDFGYSRIFTNLEKEQNIHKIYYKRDYTKLRDSLLKEFDVTSEPIKEVFDVLKKYISDPTSMDI